jgi:glycosyltransferase involved in cell wall biosynthesis
MGLNVDSPLVLFVGNLLPVKNPHLLLQAFAQLPPNARLVLAGKGPMRAELETAATALGIAARTTFLGPQTSAQIGAWMRAADLLCMTSHNEGLPNVVLEARACGLPVVATNVGGIHEIIDDASKGALTMPNELDPLVTALNATLASTANAPPPPDASWQSTADAYHAILTRCLQR